MDDIKNTSCGRCKENEAKYSMSVPFQEEDIELCQDCYVLVWELFAKWLKIRYWESKIAKFENKLEREEII